MYSIFMANSSPLIQSFVMPLTPFEAPRQSDREIEENLHPRSAQKPFTWMIGSGLLFAILGPFVGVTVFSIGHLLATLLLESYFVPPLKGIENWGQFGFYIIYFGLFGSLWGLSWIVIPVFGLRVWLPFSAVVLATFLYFDQLAVCESLRSVPNAAFFLDCAIFIGLAVLASFANSRLRICAYDNRHIKDKVTSCDQ